MLSRLIAFALAQRLLMGVATLALIAAGIFAMRELPIDAFPDVSSTQVKIILKAPGMTPAEVESRIVAPIEQELLGIPHQKMLRSMSKYAIADITVAGVPLILCLRLRARFRASGVSHCPMMRTGALPSSIHSGVMPMAASSAIVKAG